MDGNSKSAIAPVVTQLGVAATQLSPTVQPNYSVQIDSIIVSNVTAVAQTFDLYLHPVGVTPGATNAICVGVALAANTLYILNSPIIIPAGWRLSGLASLAASINVVLCGYIVNETVH